MRVLISVLCLLMLPFALMAQERPKAILVLDASGSMWGQIEGKAKITIAQEVMGTLLSDLPDTQDLGLTVYGHRRKGDCSDIETIVSPGADTRGAIGSAVNGIKPKGKTPMTDAVIAAAEALRYTEEKATVILVSDGIETCAPDPCAAAKTLEESGVDFTAHVVGFDVTDEEALRQMQCIADETGGTFRTAADADELSEALITVAVAPEPRDVTFRATDGPGGREITTNLIWTIRGPEEVLADSEPAVLMTFPLLPGTYTAEALRPEDEEYVEVTVEVLPTTELVTLVFPEKEKPVRINVQATDGKNGPIIGKGLKWQLFDKDGAPIGAEVAEPRMALDLTKGEYKVTVLRELDGATGEAVFGVGKVGKKVEIALPEYRPGAKLSAPESAPLGSLATVRWEGPDAKNDYVAIVKPGAKERTWINYTYTREGSPLQVLMPPEPGTYELRYVLNDGGKTLATRQIEVTPIDVTLSAPETGTAGANITVDWVGPDAKNDYIAVVAEGAKEGTWINYTYTRQGTPLQVQLPVEPGRYELRYVLAQKATTMARRTVEVTELSTSVNAPETAAAGSTITVDWVGGDYKNDYISVADPGEADNRYINYTYTREGSPLQLRMPAQPGTYEVRYVLAQDAKVVARRTIEVTPVSAGLTVPTTAPAGSPLTVTWEGPDYQNDYISVAKPGEKATRYVNYTYTREGSPLRLVMPPEPGNYVIRYVMNARGDNLLAEVPITVEPVTANLTAETTVAPGGNLAVTWDGPDYRNDFISIAKVGDDGYETYTYTREGSPLIIKAPQLPGTYELRYVMRQGSTVLATQTFEVK